MFSLRNIVATMALLGALPLISAAPAAQTSAIAQLDSNEPTVANTIVSFEADDDLQSDIDIDTDTDASAGNELDGEDILNILNARETKCFTTSAKGKDCHVSQCGSDQCKVSDSNNCVWKNPKNSRPSGCLNCVCKKTSM